MEDPLCHRVDQVVLKDFETEDFAIRWNVCEALCMVLEAMRCHKRYLTVR